MDEEIAAIVERYGWYAANIADHEPPFLYTIGLSKTFEHPEFVVFGLESSNADALFSCLISDIQAGSRYTASGVYTVNCGGDEHRVGFRQVHPTQHPMYLGFAMGFVRGVGLSDGLQAMQVFWPDNRGKFPFDVGCDIGVYKLQPRLDLQLSPREAKSFERKWE